MKRKVVMIMCILVMLLGLTACNADDLNSAINDAASKAGIDAEVNITQDQIDQLEGTVKDAADKVEDVLTDEKVHDAVGNLFDSIKDAGKEE